MKVKLLTLLLLSSLLSFAQERERAIENGTYTVSAALGFPNERTIYNSHGSYGPINLTGDYQLTKRFCVGLQYSYIYAVANRQTVTKPITTKVGNSIINTGVYEKFQYEHRASYHIFTAGGEYCYLNRGRLWMACGLALGLEIPKHSVLYVLDSNNADRSNEFFFVRRTHFLYRVRFADVKFRVTKSFGLCAGIGFGLDGILTAGILYKFSGRD